MPPYVQVLQTAQPELFGSGDACGDWIIEWGDGGWFQLQAANTASSLFYALAGLQIIASAETQLARSYGLVTCFVALGAVGLHATSTVVGFVGDIVTIAATMVILVHGAIRAALAASGRSSQALEYFLPVCTAFFSVYITMAMILAGRLHTDVWFVWAGFSGLVALSSMVAATFIFFGDPLPMSASGKGL